MSTRSGCDDCGVYKKTMRYRGAVPIVLGFLGFLAIAALAACQETTVTAVGCDGVNQVVTENCISCHSGSTPSGGVDMQTNWYAAWTEKKLVVPGDAANSIIFKRITNEGHPMPPTGLMTAGNIAVVRDWINAGASCPGGFPPGG